jgi:hypothetical protein
MRNFWKILARFAGPILRALKVGPTWLGLAATILSYILARDTLPPGSQAESIALAAVAGLTAGGGALAIKKVKEKTNAG